MAGGSRPRPRNPDREINHLLSRVFYDSEGVNDAFKLLDIRTRFDLMDAIKDDETLKKMRWKDPDTEMEELVPEAVMDELKQIPSFFQLATEHTRNSPDASCKHRH